MKTAAEIAAFLAENCNGLALDDENDRETCAWVLAQWLSGVEPLAWIEEGMKHARLYLSSSHASPTDEKGIEAYRAAYCANVLRPMAFSRMVKIVAGPR